ncbi:deoxyribodipyrimidine photolyase-related protein [Saudi moumouvirus]|nr:deoxyribodipyrimidine photolyase-related protein [Saudi moumouvirus]
MNIHTQNVSRRNIYSKAVNNTLEQKLETSERNSNPKLLSNSEVKCILDILSLKI